MATTPGIPTESSLVVKRSDSAILVGGALSMARELGINKIFVHAELMKDIRRVAKLRDTERIAWVIPRHRHADIVVPEQDIIIRVPSLPLSRMSQIKVGVLTALLCDFMQFDERVLCLSGIVGSKQLDSLVIMNPQQDLKWLAETQSRFPEGLLSPELFQALVDISVRFAAEGREGKAIGTTFVIGDPEAMEPYTEQMILNPLAGHPRRARSLFEANFVETLREFSALDGAFIVDRKGVVVAAGTYLKAPPELKIRLGQGLGARHNSAAAMTAALPDCIAIVISESSGTATVFYDGKALLKIEKPVS